MSFADFETLWYMVLAERTTSMSFLSTIILLAIAGMFVVVFLLLAVKLSKWMTEINVTRTSEKK